MAKENSGGNNNISKYIGAPYNFVPLYKSVYERYKSMDELPAHDKINDSLLTGEIEYTFENKTEIYVSNGEENDKCDFYKDMKGNYAIPGSTVRGLIRSNMIILGFGSVKKDIQNNKFMYRLVAIEDKSKLKDDYKSTLGIKSQGKDKLTLKNIKAGYICKKGKKYYIYRTRNNENKTNSGSNFYIVREDYVQKDENKKRFRYIENNLMYLEDNFIPSKRGTENKSPNTNFRPMFKKISYDLKGNKVISIDKPGALENEGYVVFTGRLKDMKKKSFYVVPEADMENYVDVDDKLITYFKNDVYFKKNQLGNNKEYYSLPESDNVLKPVFYLGDEEINNFGFTPMIRIFYDHTVYDGIFDSHKKECIDYSSAIFGFSNNDNSYKSRVYFEDATAHGADHAVEKSYALMGPKASSYMDYLMENDTYNSDDFRIRGIKQYWLRNGIERNNSDKINVLTKLCPLKKGSSFTGKIKFTNLYPDELGLLLWCIRLEKGCDQNIGMGKPYGFGRIEFKDIKLRLLNNSKMYNSKSFTFDVYNGCEDTDKYIDKYKKHIEEEFLEKPIDMKSGTIGNFIKIKKETPDAKYIRYMDIDKSEYQSRNKYLDTINGVLKNIKNDKEEEEKAKKEAASNNPFGALKGLFD